MEDWWQWEKHLDNRVTVDQQGMESQQSIMDLGLGHLYFMVPQNHQLLNLQKYQLKNHQVVSYDRPEYQI